MDFIFPLLPTPVQALYTTYYAPYTTYLHPLLKRTFLLAQSFFYNTIYPLLYPVYVLITSRLNYEISSSSGRPPDNPPIISLIISLATLYISLWVLNVVRRRIFALIASLITLAFYALIVLGGVYIYYRGFEATIDDVMLLWDLFSSLERQGQRRGQGIAGQKKWEAQRKGWSKSSGQRTGTRGARYG